MNIKNNSNQIKNLIRKGKKEGYILNKDLNNLINLLSVTDKNYIKNTIENMEIQLVDSYDQFDEHKYLTGEEAIKILQSLSDGSHKAFNNQDVDTKDSAKD